MQITLSNCWNKIKRRMSSASAKNKLYIYQLPFAIRKDLCKVLDINDAWEELGGRYMNYDMGTIHSMRLAVYRGHSPTEELLTQWGTQNRTVLQLFVLLSKMQHYQAMAILKPLVDTKYHDLIYEGEENFSCEFQKMELLKISNQSNADIKPIHPSNLNSREQKKMMEKKLDKKLAHPHLDMDFLRIKEAGAASKRTDESDVTLGCEMPSNSIEYTDLEVATSKWDKRKLLGKGGFGAVYKGVWKNTEVAVKKLEIQKGGDFEETWRTNREQSLREMKYLNTCRHDNILPLYGYSIDGPHDCLVYQYMQNGSLEDRLLCKNSTRPLTWTQRHSIATGTARGIQFLHTLGDKPLVHGDIKSANILLDPHLNPKIGDFGLAREGPLQEQTHVKVSKVHGTRPYLPEEFLRAKKFSTKVDTFSFGIVLFELATGLRAYDDSQPEKFLKLRVENLLLVDRIHEIMDQKGGTDDKTTYIAMINLGVTCVMLKAKDRPEMVMVLQKLNDMTIMPQLPELSIGSEGVTSASSSTEQSKNEEKGRVPLLTALSSND